MVPSFYTSDAYRTRQARNTRTLWRRGIYNRLRKQVICTCIRSGCDASFTVQQGSPKKFCSSRCAAIRNNTGRTHSLFTKAKISNALEGRKAKLSVRRAARCIARVTLRCANPSCDIIFSKERWRKKTFCSNACAMKVTGGKPTSPRAARGKAGIRSDISPAIYFYSR